jgi:outer membrane lipoprotein-sorting protein
VTRPGALLVAALVLPGIGSAQATPTAEAVITRAARVYQTLTSFRADFRQKIDDPRVEQPETRGTLYQAGNRFAMRFTDPAGTAFVLDGQHSWFYNPEENPGQVMKMPMPTGPVYEYDLLGWFLDQPLDKYRVSYVRDDQIDGARADVLLLEPLAPTMPFRRATLWIDRESSLPRRFDIDEKLFVRHLTLSHIRTNTTIPASTFVFTIPSGVRVVEQRQ